MLPLAFLLIFAASRVELVDEVYQIPANEWRYVPVGLSQQPALVTAHFDVTSGPATLRMALLRAEDVEKLRAGAPHSVMAVTPEGARGVLGYQVHEPGEYALVIDNQGSDAAAVRTRVWLDFARHGPTVTQLSPRRQMTVVAISFAVFFGIVTLSARSLLRIVRR